MRRSRSCSETAGAAGSRSRGRDRGNSRSFSETAGEGGSKSRGRDRGRR